MDETNSFKAQSTLDGDSYISDEELEQVNNSILHSMAMKVYNGDLVDEITRAVTPPQPGDDEPFILEC